MIRKTRLLAGFMTAVLLSTTCLGGVNAAGEEGITTLNASVTEDESTTWNATVTAGETLFPEGTELRFAVADEEKKATVQEQLMTEISAKEENAEDDTTAGKTLQDLHVYDFSLTDAEKAEIDYTDKVTYSVKSASAADTDTDATDYVIYRVNEEEDSGEGAIVTLEPIEDSTGTVKLDGSGWMTEFSVKTEPVERIAVAVYKTAAAETEESSEEGDGTEEEENAGDVGVSTFAVNVDNSWKVKDPQKVSIDSYAPMNRLMILNNIPGASVQVLNKGTRVSNVRIISPENEIADNKSANDAMSCGDFEGTKTGNHTTDGPAYRMYTDMCGTESDTKYGGIAVLFEGSSVDNIQLTDYVGETDKDNVYKWYYDAGWHKEDKTLNEENQMYVELLYTNAGYYNGRLVNARAKIMVTPSKNRNPENLWYDGGANDSTGYSGTYSPMLQVSGSLFRGWVWQNVQEFHVDLTFYYTSDTAYENPIEMNDTANDPYNSLDFESMYTTYYTINSLNPARNTYEQGEDPERYIGAEYILPTQSVANVYIMEKDESTGFESNIRTTFNGWTDPGKTELQYAYNGGTNAWGWMGDSYDDGKDHIGSSGWEQNSVTIIPERCNCLSFTMGKMSVNPNNNEYQLDGSGDKIEGTGDLYPKNYTQATDIMWATISTEPFAQTRVPINIEVTKLWSKLTAEEEQNLASITVQLWLRYNTQENVTTTQKETQLREITIMPDANGDWKGMFELIPDQEFYIAQGYYNPVYVLKETQVIDKEGNDITAQYSFSGNTVITNATRDETTDDRYDINEEFQITNTRAAKGSVTINKKAIDTDGETNLPNVEFLLQAATVEGDVWTADTTQGAYSKNMTTDENGAATFSDLEEGNYLLIETKTVSGYTLLKEPVKITIPYVMNAGDPAGSPGTGDGVAGSDGKTYYYNLTYTITNGQSFDLPQTGGTSADRIMRTGMVLFVTAAGALLYLNRKRREQQKS